MVPGSVSVLRWVVGAGSLAGILAAGPVFAGDCGGPRPCGCGDRVVQSTILAADLGPCPGDGLRLVAGVSLDGGGHAIRGSRPVDTAGVIVTERAAGGFVQNLEVSGFERGVRLVGARGAQVTNVHSHHNGDRRTKVGYGIDVAGGSSGNRIERCRVHDNADEGVHFGSASSGNKLLRSEIADNARENVYFLDSSDNVVEDCEVRGGGNDSFYVKNSRGTVLARNRVADRPLTVRGSSIATVILDNRLEGAGILVTDYRDKKTGETLVPARTTVRGGRIANRGACLRSEAGSSTTIEGVELACKDDVVVSGGSVVTGVGTKLSVRCEGAGEVRYAAAGALAGVAPGDDAAPDLAGATIVRSCGGGAKESVRATAGPAPRTNGSDAVGPGAGGAGRPGATSRRR